MQVILFSAIAGIVGMGLGGAVSALLGKSSPESMCKILSFAGGVMVAIVCLELIPEAEEVGGLGMVVLGLVLGALVVMGLNRLIDKITIRDRDGDSLKLHHTHADQYHQNKIIGNPALLRSGFIMLAAISLHNLPEGIAIGAAGAVDYQMGMILAIVIMIHCIPEGMAIAAPLIGGGVSKSKAVFLTALSGVPTVIGGAIGLFIGGISDTALALALSGAGGAMLYVVFGEILPQSAVMTKSRFTTLFAFLGILVGLVIVGLH